LTSRTVVQPHKTKITSRECLSGLTPDALCRFNLYLLIKLNIR